MKQIINLLIEQKMKKVLLSMSVVALIFTASAVTASNPPSANNMATVTTGGDFMKSTAGTWAGKDGKTWYKLNAKDASLWTSTDGKTWMASKDGMWQDKDGKWLKIVDKMLKWSADGGKTWSDVPEWKWQGGDGVWNKFDKDWSLWTAKA
jgi:hypothetical protein